MDFNASELCAAAKKLGFFEASFGGVENVRAKDEIRAICGNGMCQNYGTNWLCPPGAPSTDECRATVSSYSGAFVLLSKKAIDENCDFEREMREHNAKIYAFCELLKGVSSERLILSTGACELCSECAYPEKCRHPDRHRESLCAFGIDAGELCAAFGIDYRFVRNELNLVGVVLVK